MGYLSTYGLKNKITMTALCIKYVSSYEIGSVLRVSGPVNNPTVKTVPYPFWKVTRYATKQYKYVGLDYKTALACARVKRAMYTRTYTIVNNITNKPILACLTEVVPLYVGGKMWEVVITVNETDDKFGGQECPTDIESFFEAENQREYDEQEEDGIELTLTGVLRGSNATHISYTASIEDINPRGIALEYYNSASWTSLGYISDGIYEPLPLEGSFKCRITYGKYTSNEVEV